MRTSSKIRREKRKEEHMSARALAARMSRLQSCSFSVRIFQQTRDCSQSGKGQGIFLLASADVRGGGRLRDEPKECLRSRLHVMGH